MRAIGVSGLSCAVLLLACKPQDPSPRSVPSAAASGAVTAPAPAKLSRTQFNRNAIRRNFPVVWTADTNKNGAPDPDEIRPLVFFPTEGRWVSNGAFTPEFLAAYEAIETAEAGLPKDLSPGEATRRKLVVEELDQGETTTLITDLRASPASERQLVANLLLAAKAIDEIHATMTGAKALEAFVPKDDPESQSLFRRSWGPRCTSVKLRDNPLCTAIPGGPRLISDLYPRELQADPKYCEALEKRPDAKAVLEHFSVVREVNGKLTAVPYTEVYAAPMRAVSDALRAAAKEADPSEAALEAYLEAAAQSFTTNEWAPADEAWAKMNARNSRYYLRVAPDEVLNDPCKHKAQFHLNFARINKGSLAWQEELTPLQDEMEKSMARLIGPPYAARKVTFHLPDFIDIVFNAGDDRADFGGTAGESLPNWGKVVEEGRGRTVAMTNILASPDETARSRTRAGSLFDADAMKAFVEAPEPALVYVILHETTHNLGPSYSYKLSGKTAEAAFGGELAAMLEELKADSGALHLVDFISKKGLLTPELTRQTYLAELVGSVLTVGHGVHSHDFVQSYAQLDAIKLGVLVDDGALTFDANALAANGTDRGAFHVDWEKLPASAKKLMKLVGAIKAKNDKAGADALVKKYVDGPTLPQALIVERCARLPQETFVYAIDK